MVGLAKLDSAVALGSDWLEQLVGPLEADCDVLRERGMHGIVVAESDEAEALM